MAGKTITVYSTRGGSGKTITSVSVAKLLADKGYKTILIDVDLEAPSLIHLILPESDRPIDFWPAYLDEEDIKVEDMICKTEFDNLHVIYSESPEMGKRFLQNRKRSWWEGALRRSLQAQKSLYDLGYDFIILDNQSGTSLNSVNNMILADFSILVVRPANYGADAVESFLEEMYRILKGIKNRKDYYLWTQVLMPESVEEEKLLDEFISTYDDSFTKTGLESAGIIPFDRKLNLLLLGDLSTKLEEIPSAVMDPYKDLVARIINYLNISKAP